MPIFIVLRGRHNSGKTSSIRLANEIKFGKNPSSKKDICSVHSYNNKIIAFISEGDRAKKLRYYIENHINCDVIITACRTRGDTYDLIMSYEKNGHCVHIIDKKVVSANRDAANEDTAKKILSLLDRVTVS